MLFGAPERVAFLHTLTAKQHALMSGWLRAGEALMRRLLLIEASAYPKPNTRPLLHARRSRTQTPRSVDADKPETWRVSFRAFAPGPRRKAPSTAATKRLERLRLLGAQPGQPILIYREERERLPQRRSSSHRRRTQATRKVRVSRQDHFWVHENDLAPTRFHAAWPLAQRYEALLRAFNDPAPYAQRLARRLHATPHRLCEPLRAPPEARTRVEAFDALGEKARAAWRAHFSSA